MACAWATFACYGSMMVVSFIWGQREYPVPYAWKKLTAYLLISVAMYGVYSAFQLLDLGVWVNRGFALLLLGAFGLLILNAEKKELQRLPYLGRLVRA